jgi:hypothetical protein
MAEPLTLKAISEAVGSFWARSALALWCFAACAIAAAGLLWAGKYFQVDGAADLFHDYGAKLALAGVLLAIVAAFKTYSERPKPNIVLLPVEDQSGWAQAVQQDGSVITQFSVHFQATNVSERTIKLSEITLRRPWIRRRSILTRLLLFKDPKSNYYGSAHPVPAHTLSYGSATIIVDHALGRKGEPIRLVVALRDHAGRWHKLVFPFVRYLGPP